MRQKRCTSHWQNDHVHTTIIAFFEVTLKKQNVITQFLRTGVPPNIWHPKAIRWSWLMESESRVYPPAIVNFFVIVSVMDMCLRRIYQLVFDHYYRNSRFAFFCFSIPDASSTLPLRYARLPSAQNIVITAPQHTFTQKMSNFLLITTQ